MTVIYLDILIGLNWIIDYFLLLAAAQLLSLAPKRRRVVLGAALGGASSCIVLIPELTGILSFLFSAAAAVLMVLLTYGFHSARLFVKTLLCFYAVSFSFSGIMYAVWFFAAPNGMLWRSGIVYFDISPLLLIVMTVVCYLILTLLQRLVGRKDAAGKFFNICITVEGKTTSFRAMLDTGNSLTEHLSGSPVIVVEYDAIRTLIPEALQPVYALGRVEQIDLLKDRAWQQRFRLIPYSGVGTKSLLPAFFPDKIVVREQQLPRACVAVCRQKLSDGLYHALVPSALTEAAELRRKSNPEKLF